MANLKHIIEKMKEIESKTGCACTFTVATYGGKTPYQSYIARPDREDDNYAPSHLKHETASQALARFNDFLADEKIEVRRMLNEDIERLEAQVDKKVKMLKAL